MLQRRLCRSLAAAHGEMLIRVHLVAEPGSYSAGTPRRHPATVSLPSRIPHS